MDCPRRRLAYAASAPQCDFGDEFSGIATPEVPSKAPAAVELESVADGEEIIEIDLTDAVAMRGLPRLLLFCVLLYLIVYCIAKAQFSIFHQGETGLGGSWEYGQLQVFLSAIAIMLLSIATKGSHSAPWLQALTYLPLLLFLGFFPTLILEAGFEDAPGHGVVAASLAAGIVLLWAFGFVPIALFRAAKGLVSMRSLRTLRLAGRRKNDAESYRSFVRHNGTLPPWTIAALIGLAMGCLVVATILGPFIYILAPPVVTFLLNEIRKRRNQSVSWEAVEAECARRSTCVYLRSFWDDGSGFGPDMFWPGIWFLRPPNRRLEEVVVRTIWPFHAVVAIGDSLSGESPTEAFRAPARNDNWQSVVADLARSAQLIVLQAGFSPGLKWEHGHLRSEDALSRTLVLFPPGERSDRRDRWEALLRSGYSAGDLTDDTEPSAPGKHSILFRPQVRTGFVEFWTSAIKRLEQTGKDLIGRARNQFKTADIVDRTIACIWTEDGRRIHFTSRFNSRIAYKVALELACAPTAEVLKSVAG